MFGDVALIISQHLLHYFTTFLSLFLTIHFSPLLPLPQEYAEALNELTPAEAEEHRRSVEKALAAARELEIVKQKLDEQRAENEQKLKQENEGLLVSLIFAA